MSMWEFLTADFTLGFFAGLAVAVCTAGAFLWLLRNDPPGPRF